MDDNDFFNSVPFSTQQTRYHPTDHESVVSFAQAIASRFGSSDLLTARLLPDEQPQPPSPQPISIPEQQQQQQLTLPSPIKSINTTTFTSISSPDLPSYLADPSSLILDIRPHAAYTAARLHRAISLSIPSTLLKRPLFGLSKLVQMLPSSSACSRFAAWPNANQIIVYDADSVSVPDTSNIAGLLRKFRAEGFTGELVWIKGGFQAVWREARQCVTTDHPSPDEDDPEGISPSSSALRTKHLPKAAFSLSSTTVAGGAAASGTPSLINAANPFFDTIRQNVELSHGITERIPLRLPRRVRRRISDLPFRWLQDIARRSALRPSPSSSSMESDNESSDEPHESDPDSNDPDVEEGAETLAMQFYRIELAEQRRLRTVMEHHARESEVSAYTAAGQTYTLGQDGEGIIGSTRPIGAGAKSAPPTPLQGAFPFSITAGVEKGAKNRYNHIWPFEHARVRLHDGRHQGSHPGPKRDKKQLASDSESGSASASKSASVPEDGGMNVDRLPIRTPVLPLPSAVPMTPFHSHTAFHTPASIPATPFNGPPSVRGGVSMTPFRSFPLGTGGGYFPTMPESLKITAIPEDAPMKSPPVRSGMQVRTGGFLSPPALSLPKPSSPLSTVPKATSPLALSSSFPPSNKEMFNLTLPGVSQVRAPQQFNLAVIPPSNAEYKQSEPSPVDDYVNASYVQPLGTRKRYIATQGPLPATFVDFWTLVWEQNVHVIVMLTREIENAMVKCGTYWTDPTYGPLQLQLLNTSPPISPSAHNPSSSADAGFFLALRERDRGPKQQPSMIVRTFALSHCGYPRVPPRRVTHLQYLDWPDMNVPEDPRGVLELIERVERAVQESTPGPSPSGSGSASGSNSGSGSLSPLSGSPGRTHEMVSISKGEDFFASPPLGDAGARRKSGRRGWRHPELDAKTGIAAFALGCAPPVLLHCSAGVGRTGGFIAVDAVLDAIKREVRQRREVRAHARARIGKMDKNVIVKGERESGSGTESGGMDVDAEEGKERIIGTVPLVMGDRKKARRHYAQKGAGKQGETSSSESLVVHVPVASSPQDADAGEQTKNMTYKSSSTREWAEQVLDETQPKEGDLPPHLPLSMSLSALSVPSRERSPGSTSSSSQPSALNSVDDSVGSGSGVDGKAGSGGSGSGRSASGVSGQGSGGAPPSSSVSTSHSGSRSHSGPGSISVSGSGSGTNTSSNSGFWGSSGVESSGFMGLVRARLRDDSSATSLSNVGSDFSNEKRRMPLPRSTAVRIGSEREDAMDVDRPPRSVSVPLHRAVVASSGQPSASPLGISNLGPRTRQMIGSSPVASISTPALPTTSGAVRVSDPISRGSSNPGSDDLSPLSVEAASGNSSQVSSGDFEENVALSGQVKSGPKVAEMTSAISVAPTLEKTSKSSSNAKQIEPTESTKAKSTGAIPSSIPPVPQVVEHKIPEAELAPSELDQRAAGHAVIDYKLPRQLHQDLSPAPLMSHTNPIWTVVQDMREQRMSLCQSLRQYVFVHAAVIEGALMIVDEEREMWGESTGSEGSPEHLDDRCRSDDSDIRQIAFKNIGITEISGMGRTQSTRDRTQSFPPVGGGSSVSSSSGGHWQIPRTTTVSTSSVVSSSPSKWKRGPSPTELLKEDKSGVVSTAKRPSFHRRTPSNEQVLTTSVGAPQALSSGVGRKTLNPASGNMTHPGVGPMAPGQGDPSTTAK